MPDAPAIYFGPQPAQEMAGWALVTMALASVLGIVFRNKSRSKSQTNTSLDRGFDINAFTV